jgi:hypothetical protein
MDGCRHHEHGDACLDVEPAPEPANARRDVDPPRGIGTRRNLIVLGVMPRRFHVRHEIGVELASGDEEFFGSLVGHACNMVRRSSCVTASVADASQPGPRALS